MPRNPVRNKCRACGVAVPAHKGAGRPSETCHPNTGRDCRRICARVDEAARLLRKLHEQVGSSRAGKVKARSARLASLIVIE